MTSQVVVNADAAAADDDDEWADEQIEAARLSPSSDDVSTDL